MPWDWYIWAIGALSLLTAIAGAVWYFTRPLPRLPETPALPLPVEPIHLRFEADGSLPLDSRLLEDQSALWRASLKTTAEVFQSHKVREIVLLHGTFVGSDPVNILSSMRAIFPKVTARVELGMSRRMRGLIDKVAQDNGNFIPAYAELLQKGLGGKIPVSLFYWSSANHHLARLEGAVGLLERLAQRPLKAVSDRILYVGHSHARQVFALYTHLLNAAGDLNARGSDLWAFVEQEGLASPGLQLKTAQMRRRKLKVDFVTLGGPVRYAWCFIPEMKVLHIVNHNGETSTVRNPLTFWNTSSGDHVQQWGSIGSDAIAPTPRERTLNRRLDIILGKGWHTRLWLQSIIRRERLGDFGRTLLIDYFHTAKPKTNFVKTVFGHGVYTRFDVMQFQFELIGKYMYGGK